MMKDKLVFIINPKSGTVSKERIPSLIEKRLNKERFDYSVVYTEYAGHATEIARQAAKDGAKAAIAVGGDGTINEVGCGLIHTDTALGIIPCGSGNGMARHLMLPMDAPGAIDTINTCGIHTLDFGVINDRPFFCTCGMGFDAFISMKFAEAGRRGLMTYLENVLREGLKYEPETYEVEDENGKREYKAFLISIANASQYGNNAYIAPQASMSDGLLDVIIIEPFDVIDAPQVSIDLMNKTLDKNPKVKTFKAKNIHIKRSKAGLIHYDGDPVMSDSDIDVRIECRGINVIVNPNADKSHRQPNMVQTAVNDIFNDINSVRKNITRQGRKVQEIDKKILKKLNL